jgi:hypothetical protein
VNTDSSTIAHQVEVMGNGMASEMPTEVLAALGVEQASLDAAGIPADAARAGTVMPDGHLLDAHGSATTLHDASKGKPTVVVFYVAPGAHSAMSLCTPTNAT